MRTLVEIPCSLAWKTAAEETGARVGWTEGVQGIRRGHLGLGNPPIRRQVDLHTLRHKVAKHIRPGSVTPPELSIVFLLDLPHGTVATLRHPQDLHPEEQRRMIRLTKMRPSGPTNAGAVPVYISKARLLTRIGANRCHVIHRLAYRLGLRLAHLEKREILRQMGGRREEPVLGTA